jgi:Zn ribbon nucleic-acid-binding protein
MFNRERTKEVFGYDIDPTVKRRSKLEFLAQNSINKKNLIVINNCPNCNAENKITYRASIKNRICYKCFHNSEKMIEAKKNQNKEVSEETKNKMSANHWSKHGFEQANKGKKMDDDFKQKISIAIKKWNDGFSEEIKKDRGHKAAATKAGVDPKKYTQTTVTNIKARGLPEYKEWEKAVFKRDGNYCIISDCSYSRLSNIAAHHLDGFHWCIEKRHLVDNGVTLCKYHHRAFHSVYGCHNNTKDQFDQWITSTNNPDFVKPTIFMVIGCSGSGKSWVCNQLKDDFQYISYDGSRKRNHIPGLMEHSSKPKLYDPPIKVSTFFKRHSHRFNIRCVAILETDDVVKERIKIRGGIWTNSISKRNAVMVKRAAKYGEFSGTSQEVLDYLKAQIVAISSEEKEK